MLVANPGQTYSLHSQATANCHNNSRNNVLASSKSSGLNATSASSGFAMAKPAQTIFQPSRFVRTNAHEPETNPTTKTLSIRLNRGNEYSKETEQKTQTAKIPSHFSKLFSLNTVLVPPTDSHRFPDRSATNSADSLNKEMCHFKPIRTAPTTPNKKSRYSFIKTPIASITMPKSQDCKDEMIARPKLSSEISLLIHSVNSAFCVLRGSALCKKNEINSLSYKTTKADKVKSLTTSQEAKWNNAQNKCNKKVTRKTNVAEVKKINNSKEKKEKSKKESAKKLPTRRSRRVAKNQEEIPEQETQITSTKGRKRKNPSTEEIPLRKSARLSKGNSETSKSIKSRKAKQPSSCFSPPLTRSRLKKSVNLRATCSVTANCNQK